MNNSQANLISSLHSNNTEWAGSKEAYKHGGSKNISEEQQNGDDKQIRDARVVQLNDTSCTINTNLPSNNNSFSVLEEEDIIKRIGNMRVNLI